MKRTFTTLALAFAGIAAQAQNNVGINNTNPDPSAALDITSSNQGILVPRMNTMDRTGIQAPAQGLLVFDIDENVFFYFNGFGWERVGDNLGNHTAAMHLNMANKEIRNASRMAIGTAIPAAGAALDVVSTTSTFLPPRMTTLQRDALTTVPDGSMIYNVDIHKWQGGYSYTTTPLNISPSQSVIDPIASGQTMGQTFISPSTAPLSSITLNMTYTTWATGTITCKLYTAPGGTLLATSAYTAPMDQYQSSNPDFPFTGVSLTASTSYYVEFTVTHDNSHALYHYYDPNTYSGGQAYYNNVANSSRDLPIDVNFPSNVTSWNDLN